MEEYDEDYEDLGHFDFDSDEAQDFLESEEEVVTKVIQPTYKSSLVVDVLHPIAMQSTPTELLQLCRINKYGLNICADPGFWKAYFVKHHYFWPDQPPTTIIEWIKLADKNYKALAYVHFVIDTFDKSFDYDVMFTAYDNKALFYYDDVINNTIDSMRHIHHITHLTMFLTKGDKKFDRSYR